VEHSPSTRVESSWRRCGVDASSCRDLSQAATAPTWILSVAHDNVAAIALYEKLGFARVPVMAVKRKNAINEPLFTTHLRLSTTSIRTRASSPTKPCAEASGSRYSTPKR